MGFFKGLVQSFLGKKQIPTTTQGTTQRENLDSGDITLSIGVVPPTPEQEAVWKKKREATALNRAGDTSGAVKALEEAQNLEGHSQAHDEIRRAKYLQKDGRTDDAWAIYVSLLDESTSPWIDVGVLDAMRLHLQRDAQAERAIEYGIAHRVACVTLYRDMMQEAQEALNGPMPDHLQSIGDDALAFDLWERQRENHRLSIELAEKWITDLTNPTDLGSGPIKLLA